MSVNLSYDAALEALNSGRPGDAVSICQSALKRDSKDHRSAHLLGLILLNVGQIAAAVVPLSVAARANPLDDALSIQLAQAVRTSGEGKARPFILRALLARPESVLAQVQLAEWSAAEGDGSASVAAATRATIVEPGNAGHRYLLAQCWGGLENGQGALSEIRRAYLLQPEHPSIIRYLGDVSAWHGLANDAERHFCHLCFIDPSDAEAWHRRGNFAKERRQHKLASHSLTVALLLEPQKSEAWRTLYFLRWFLHDARAASKAAAGWVSCDPHNPDAWIGRFSAMNAVQDKKGFEHCLTMLEPMASRAPAVRQALALERASEGDGIGAEQHLDLFFSRIHERLHESQPDLLRDSGFVGFLIFHLLRGEDEKVLDYIERSQDCELAHPMLDLDIFKIHHVASAMRQYRENPIAWKTEKRLLVSVLVWGEEFSDIWLKYGLSSLLSEENKKLWDSRETVFQFVSTPETLNYLRQQPVFAKLEALYRISFIDITQVLTAGFSQTNYIAMLIAQWVPMCIGANENADCISLGADSFFSKAAFSYIAQRLEEGKTDVFYTLDYPISASAVAEIEFWRNSDGVLEIPEQDLGRFFLENISSRVEPYYVHPADSTVPSDPSRVYSRLEHGVIIRSLQPQLIYVCSSMLKNLWMPRLSATDNGFADAALAVLGDSKRMEMLVQPDLFGCAVIEDSEEDRIASGQIPRRIPVKETVASDLLNLIRGSGLLSPARVWSFRQPMFVLGEGEAADTRNAFVDQLAAQLPHQGKYGILNMMAEHGNRAFERFQGADGVPK